MGSDDPEACHSEGASDHDMATTLENIVSNDVTTRNPSDEDESEDPGMTDASECSSSRIDKVVKDHIPDCESGMEDEDEDEEEMPPLEYARMHDLTTSYINRNTASATWLPYPETYLADEHDLNQSLIHDDSVFINAQAKANSGERWNVDRETAQFLAGIIALGKDEYSEALFELHSSSTFRDLRLQEPILASDPASDLARLKNRNAVSISTEGMKPFHLDEEKDEGMSWPAVSSNSIAERMKKLTDERLDVDVETVKYLKETASPPDLNNQDLIDDGQNAPTMKPLTPPLLPLSPPLSPVGMSGSVCDMDLTSSPDDLVAKEAKDMERLILAGENDPVNLSVPMKMDPDLDASAKQYCSSLRTPAQSSSSPRRPKRIADLEADVPLIPYDAIEPLAKKPKSVSFTETLHTLIPFPEPIDELPDVKQDIDAFLKNVAMPLADSVMDRIKNETLFEFDTTLRITVPPIEAEELMPPWTAILNESDQHRHMISRIKSEMADDKKRWGSVSKAERRLPWSPFPTRLGKVKLEESFDDGSLARYMAELTFDDRIDTQSLLWKPDGLRILDANDGDSDDVDSVIVDEDEHVGLLEESSQPAQPEDTVPHTPVERVQRHETPSDLRTLLLNRKIELEAAKDAKRLHLETNQMGDQTPNDSEIIETNPTGLVEPVTGSALLGFLRLHGVQSLNTAQRPQHPKIQQSAPTIPAVEPVVGRPLAPKIASKALPFPSISTDAEYIAVVASSTFMASRQLSRQLQNLLPSIDLIERSPTEPPTIEPQTKNTQPVNKDADIALSPSTGLLVTNIQKLTQKPLPGQHSFFGIRERIDAVCLNFERLIVLISEGGQMTENGSCTARSLDARDAEALSDLMDFTASLDTDVGVYYVPGSDVELARWIAAAISHHATSYDDAKLLHDETLWERLLRVAGMNAFAAQVMLAKLKMPDNLHGHSDNSTTQASPAPPAYGLAAFVQMTAEQRVQRFGHVMGGDTVLRRCSEAIDRGWISVSGHKAR